MSSANQTKIIIQDFQIPALIGIFPEEIGNKQSIIVNIEAIFADYRVAEDKIEATISYVPIIEEIRRISNIQFSLVEKMADHLAEFCLAIDRIASVKIKIEKPDIFPEGRVGTEIYRSK